MKIALVNPRWTFDGSIYFGCREPHLPLEFGYAKCMLEAEGHEAIITDGQMDEMTRDDIRARIRQFHPDFTVITTAPSYLFWRCAPPEVRVPRRLVSELRDVAGVTVAVGPHTSTTPRAALHKLGADAGIIGEPECVLPKLVATPRDRWPEVARCRILAE